MVSSDKKKPSVSGQPNAAALVTVAGSELDFYTNSNYLAFESAQYAAAQRQGKLASDLIDDDLSEEDDPDLSDGGDETEGKETEEGASTDRPKLSDVEVLSNEVVEDPVTKILSAKIVFKVKNSSGVNLKAINVRVEKK